ncbi:MAG: hypothetical protein M1826_006073 [Phylliscum demangeonii]|nr:MAG: hypothetical protein M1826_006073 [Phylliscum demangeonii]
MKIDWYKKANMRLLVDGHEGCLADICSPLVKSQILTLLNMCRHFCNDRWTLPGVFEPARVAEGGQADLRYAQPRNSYHSRFQDAVLPALSRGVQILVRNFGRDARKLALPLRHVGPAVFKKEAALAHAE